ncbi:MAG: hypothetical protein ACRCU2_28765 [Planktothrix sp.]
MRRVNLEQVVAFIGSLVRKATAISLLSFWQKAMSSGGGFVGVENLSPPKRKAILLFG